MEELPLAYYAQWANQVSKEHKNALAVSQGPLPLFKDQQNASHVMWAK